MGRLQLALNVSDIDEAVDFYQSLFGAPPAKHYADYANFALDDPPLKLVLIESEDAGGTINHLGVEVTTSAEVSDATERLSRSGLATRVENNVGCCYAVQDKVWVQDPDSAPWEIYRVLSDTTEPAACC